MRTFERRHPWISFRIDLRKAAPTLWLLLGDTTMKAEFSDAPGETVGQRIGRYKTLECVGEGGCGVVYVAEQAEPARRRVALKVIKLGMDTKQVVATRKSVRFMSRSCVHLRGGPREMPCRLKTVHSCRP